LNQIKKEMKEEKWKSLGMEKQKVVEFENGYREFYPKDYKNPECWQTDSEEEAYRNNRRKGLLPLRSEIEY